MSKISYFGFDTCSENIEQFNERINSDEIKSLGLKTIQAATEVDEKISGNICIFANVIHEIHPDVLAKTLNNYFHLLKPESECYILEKLELNVGERAFVTQYPESIEVLFDRLKKNGFLECCAYEAKAPNGRPLMHAYIKIKDPKSINVSDADVLESLKKIVAIESDKLRNHYMNPSDKLKATLYSFHSHNLANAVTFINIIENKVA